jgi:hypothetical protein
MESWICFAFAAMMMIRSSSVRGQHDHQDIRVIITRNRDYGHVLLAVRRVQAVLRHHQQDLGYLSTDN